MFSGIVEKMAPVVSITKRSKSALIQMDLGKLANGTKIGDSICVNGVCLTVTKKRKESVSFDVIDETLRVTNLGELIKGSKVNVERSLLLTDRIGGHLVSGHVDGVGKIAKIEQPAEDSVKLWIKTRADLLSSMIPKGSVAVDGISLTLVDVGESRFSVCLIPHTLSITTLGHKTEGDSVNLEVDAIAKYVRKYLDQMNLKESKL
jgi:riboflavin synthase